MFAHLLVLGIQTLRKQGLEVGYRTYEEPTSTIKGRIVFSNTLPLLATAPGKVSCAFDEMSVDILSNRILKATLRRILGEDSLEKQLRTEVRRSLTLLQRVGEVELNERTFHRAHMHRNNRLYAFLLNICHFFYQSLQPHERAGHYRFRGLDRDEIRMRRIFEKFVRNFFRRRQRSFSVKVDQVRWDATALAGSNIDLLPRMKTDVTLRSASRTVIIECKYTESLYQRNFLRDKLRSAHLYQLNAYLRNFASESVGVTPEGILLYPTAGQQLDESYRMQGHSVRVKTVDLARPWQDIEADLLRLIGC